MTSVSTDLRNKVDTTTAIKIPVKVATTANITLSAEQTIDDVSVVTGDRVLVKDQTDASENGIWIVDSSKWKRAKDWNGIGDIVTGTIVYVTSGTAGGVFYQVTTTGTITPGSTDVAIGKTFVLGDLAAYIASTNAGKGASNIGVEDSAGSFTGTDLETVLAELVAANAGDLKTGFVDIPIHSWREASSFDVETTANDAGKLSNNSGPSLKPINSFGGADGARVITWAKSNTDSIIAQVSLPNWIDTSSDMEFHFRASAGIGSTNVDMTLKAFFNESDTVLTYSIDEAGNGYREIIVTIDAADIPSGAQTVTFSLAHDIATVKQHKVTATWLEFTPT